MARIRTARQRAASRKNLIAARKKRRRRIAVGVAAVAGVGAAAGGAAVAYHRPVVLGSKTKPFVVSRRNLGKHNYPHTEDQKAYSAIKYLHSGSAGKKQRAMKVSQAEAMRRTNSYMSTVKPKRATSARRDYAHRYYSNQMRYDATGTSGRRGRARSRELRARTK